MISFIKPGEKMTILDCVKGSGMMHVTASSENHRKSHQDSQLSESTEGKICGKCFTVCVNGIL
jgi:hypothetical protein